MTQTALVDVSLEESSNDDGSDDDPEQTGRIKATVTDTDNKTLVATVEVSGEDSFHETKETASISGMTTFTDVPVQAYTVTISADGYETVTEDVAPEDFSA